MNRYTSQFVRPSIVIIAVACWWLCGPVEVAVAQGNDLNARLVNVAQAVERMGDVFDNPDLSRDWVAHVEAQIWIVRAEYDALRANGNGQALAAVEACRLTGEHLRHALVLGDRNYLMRSSELLHDCSLGLQAFGVASSPVWGPPIGVAAAPAPAVVPVSSAVPASPPAPVALTEIGTLAEWRESNAAQRLHMVGLWAERLVDSGTVTGNPALLTAHLLICVDSAVTLDTMATLGVGYPVVEVAIWCALAYTPPGTNASDRVCNIKGNVNSSAGTFIYHTPASPWYDRTDVNPENGDRWFCSEQEAIEAGFRPPAR